jgi:membrane protein
VVLIWVYYSAQILFFGAELTKAYANRYGQHIEPIEGAKPLLTITRVEEPTTAPRTPPDRR